MTHQTILCFASNFSLAASTLALVAGHIEKHLNDSLVGLGGSLGHRCGASNHKLLLASRTPWLVLNVGLVLASTYGQGGSVQGCVLLELGLSVGPSFLCFCDASSCPCVQASLGLWQSLSPLPWPFYATPSSSKVVASRLQLLHHSQKKHSCFCPCQALSLSRALSQKLPSARLGSPASPW